MRLVTPIERVLIALGPSRNVALLDLDEPVSSVAVVAQVMAWVDIWPRFRMVFHDLGPWYGARQADIDPARHVIAVEAGDATREALFVAALTGTLDPDIPPWQVIVANPADGAGRGPCRIIVHFDHLIADGVRFVNLLAASRHHDQPAAFEAAAKRLRRLSLEAFLGAPRDQRVIVPDVALLTTTIDQDVSDDDGGRGRPTRRLTRAITQAVAKAGSGRLPQQRCAAVAMLGRRQGSKANAVTAVEVDTTADGAPPPGQSPVSALLGRLARRRWFMQAGQTFLSVVPARSARWLTAQMVRRWDGLLTLVPFGRRPLYFAGRQADEIWCLTVPVVPVPLFLLASAYRNRYYLTVVTEASRNGKARAFATALDDVLNRPPA